MPKNQADYDKGVALQKKLRGSVPPPAGRAALAELAPAMDEILTEVIFGRVWTRPELDLKIRSAVTIASLMALQRLPQLKQHILYGLNLGLTREEIVEILTHVAWYAGVPTAVNALQIAKEAFAEAGK